MAATPKPMRTKQKKIANEMREFSKESIPHKGTRKEIAMSEVKFAKERIKEKAATPRLAKMVKSYKGGDYEGMMKSKKSKKK